MKWNPVLFLEGVWISTVVLSTSEAFLGQSGILEILAFTVCAPC